MQVDVEDRQLEAVYDKEQVVVIELENLQLDQEEQQVQELKVKDVAVEP